MTTPMPEQAQKIAEILRRDVPRPEDLPELRSGAGCTFLRWGDGCCPMGLHPDASNRTPAFQTRFPPDTGPIIPGGQSNTTTFASWWDDQTDAQAAVDAVWGTQ